MDIVKKLLALPFMHLLIELGLFFVLSLLLSLGLLFVEVPRGWQDVILYAISALAGVITLLLARRWPERLPSVEGVGLSPRHALRDSALGLFWGSILVAGVLGLLALPGWYRVTGMIAPGQIPAFLLHGLLLFLAGAIYEEAFFRGIIFRLLERIVGSWGAVVLSAALFGLAHLLNPHATILSALTIMVEAGVTFAAIYMVTRSLWAVTAAHFGWNLMQGTILGAPVSGIAFPGILHASLSGPEIWTGGSFGVEGSLITLCLGVFLAVYFLRLAQRKGQIYTPEWMRKLLLKQQIA